MSSDELTLFAEDTPASHSAQPGSDEARKMTVISGRKCIGSWLPCGPVGDCLRMLLGTSAWASTRCFLTWRAKATPHGRLLFQLAPSMPRTDETWVWILAHRDGERGEAMRGKCENIAEEGTSGGVVGSGRNGDVKRKAPVRGSGENNSIVADAQKLQRNGGAKYTEQGERQVSKFGNCGGAEYARQCKWLPEPDVGRVANGVPRRVDRLKGLGNAVVPQIPEMIGRAILEAEGMI